MTILRFPFVLNLKLIYRPWELAKAVIGTSKIAIGTSLCGPVADFYCNAKALLVVLYCLLELAKALISIAEIAIGTSLSGPVADVFSNAQLLLVVLYSFPFCHLAVLV